MLIAHFSAQLFRQFCSFNYRYGCSVIIQRDFKELEVTGRIKMQIFVRGTQQHVLDCEETETIANLKNRLSSLEGIAPEEILLYSVGEPIVDDAEVGNFSNQIIDLNVGLLGGKVHGSLARAGKVKGQTPKVDKQEKKKKKTGRAKRRFQYNRRFVNIVQGFGRKRGPNAAPS